MRLKQIIAEMMIYDGLEMTYSIDSAINNLVRQWGLNGNAQYSEVDGTIVMKITGQISIEYLDLVINHINNVLGYFPAHVTTPNVNFKYDKGEIKSLLDNFPFAIYFDAKYDIEIDSKALPDILYHISPTTYKEKILKVGLVPKTKNKLSSHPSRIYLTTSEKSAIGLTGNIAFKQMKISLFEIEYMVLKKHRKIRFFSDPAYSKNGIYTYENIPPEYIENVRDIQ